MIPAPEPGARSGGAIPRERCFTKAALRLTDPKEGLVAYAISSSPPYSWQKNVEFLNYTQWKQGATWSVADYYPASGDANTPARSSAKPAPADLPPRTNEKV